MQYDNGSTASEARAIVRAVFAILGICSVAAFIGEFDLLYQIRWIIVGLFTLVVIVALFGGMCEVSLVADEKFIELSCGQVLWPKGGNAVYSIEANRLIDHKRLDILFLHFLSIDYVSHRGGKRTAHVGLTLVGKRRREKLMNIIRRIEEANEAASLERGCSVVDMRPYAATRAENISEMLSSVPREVHNRVKQTTI